MIRDVFFVIRILGLTVLVSLFLQVQVGQITLEDHFQSWVKSSFVVDSLQDVIDGGVALTRAGYKKADSGVRALLSRIGRRGGEAGRDRANAFGFKLKRHYEKDDEVDYQEEEPTRSPAKAPQVKAGPVR
jgi:hypothetical protein